MKSKVKLPTKVEIRNALKTLQLAVKMMPETDIGITQDGRIDFYYRSDQIETYSAGSAASLFFAIKVIEGIRDSDCDPDIVEDDGFFHAV